MEFFEKMKSEPSPFSGIWGMSQCKKACQNEPKDEGEVGAPKWGVDEAVKDDDQKGGEKGGCGVIFGFDGCFQSQKDEGEKAKQAKESGLEMESKKEIVGLGVILFEGLPIQN